MKQNKLLSLIGIAMKAGKLVSGEFSTETAIKSGKAYLVIITGDASKNTVKKFTNSCAFYNVPILTISTKEELGAAIGKQQRSSTAVLDEGFANAIMKKMDEIGGNLNGEYKNI